MDNFMRVCNRVHITRINIAFFYILVYSFDFLMRIIALRDLPWLLMCIGIAAKCINNRQTRARTYLYIYEGRHCLRNGFREKKLCLRAD